MSTSIAVVGPGAIGSSVAALLYAAGHRVILCGHTPRRQIEVRADAGVGSGGTIIVPGPVHTDPAEVTTPVDIVLLAVKATQNNDAGRWLAGLCDEHTVVCVLQNGVEQVEQVGPHCPESTVVPAIVWFPAETMPEGWVRLRDTPRLVLPCGDAAERLAALLRDAGCTVTNDPDFVTAAWRKLLVNAVAGLMALTGRRAAMFGRDDIAVLARNYATECLSVARAEGAHLPDEVAEEIVTAFATAAPDLGTSILADREAHRPMEWDIRNGVIARRGARHGLPTPISGIVMPLLAATSDGPG